MRPLYLAPALCLAAGCPGPPGPIGPISPGAGLDSCQTIFTDGGVVGTAAQAFAAAGPIATQWRSSVRPIDASSTVGPDGIDQTGSWTVGFNTPDGLGVATAVVAATSIVVAGSCAAKGGFPALVAWNVDSSAAIAIAADAGCVLPSEIPIQLLNQVNPTSPFAPTDPTWLLSGAFPDGGPRNCYVDAVNGTFGAPDAGTDGGRDAGPDAG
ncbi:MAG: hypothetical protein ACYCWW_20890 [Deltaproteobacteria bacterium]